MSKDIVINARLKAQGDFSDAIKEVSKYQKLLENLKLSDKLKNSFTEIFGNIEKNAKKVGDALGTGFKTKGDVTKYEKAMQSILMDMNKLQHSFAAIPEDKLREAFVVDDSKLKSLRTQLVDTTSKLQNLIKESKEYAEIQKEIEKIGSGKKMFGESTIKKLSEALNVGDFREVQKVLDSMERTAAKIQNTSKKGQYQEVFDSIKQSIIAIRDSGDIKDQVRDVASLQNAIKNFNGAQLEEFVSSYKQLTGADLTQLISQVTRLYGEEDKAAQSSVELSNSLEGFKTKAAYFFGLTNAVNLFKRSLRAAFETVKDLDAVMTETAVVTDFNVGDMWDQLPEYTARANELGVSIHDAYEAATLYYQQGLKTNEVMAVSNETLKMARIAGLDAAEATSRMTNALRGFNMEINEGNAQRVNDVYSELAAITAADTDEISRAMTKVASLAHNANMEFETTSAFLAQVIETTRESAETAGTALKTVIARFSEVKDLYNQGELMGTDEEGEEIDVNKVSVALRSAGINLNEYLTGAKGLDDIFIELASKWDSLDMVQQRYIATMAAGSRQQSRFIAMMSDYSRTMELVNAANTSAGSSQRQFEKTLESLQSKLEKLKNSWNTFLMGIADNTAIKWVIDRLTEMIDAINRLTKNIDGLGGSIVRLGGSFVALKIGGNIVNRLLKGFGAAKMAMMKEGQSIGTAFFSGFKKASTSIFSKKYWQDLVNVGKVDTDGFSELGEKITQLKEKQEELNSLQEVSTTAQEEYNKVREEANALSNIQCNIQNIATSQEEKEILLHAAMKDEIVAETLSRDKLTDEQKEDVRVRALAIHEQEKENAVRGKSLFSVVAATFAQQKMTDSLKGSTLHTWLLTKAEGEGITAKLADAAATKVATMATWQLVAAMVAAALAVAAVIAVIIIIVNAYKKLKENSPEAVLKKTQQATEAAKQASDEAAESYNNLNEALKSLDERYETIESLTRGTQAWRDAIEEVNNEVLGLMGTYEGLSLVNDNGVLKIANEEEIKRQAQERKDNAVSALIGMQKQTTAAQLKTKEEKYSFSYGIKMPMETNTGVNPQNQQYSVTQEQKEEYEDFLQKLAKYVASNEMYQSGDYKENVRNYASKMGYEMEVTDEVISNLRDYGNAILETEEIQKQYNSAIAAQAMSGVGVIKGTEEQVNSFLDNDKIQEVYNKRFNEVSERNSKEVTNELLEKLNVKDKDEYKEKYGQELTDENAKIQLAQIYALDDLKEIVHDFSIGIDNARIFKNGDLAQAAYSSGNAGFTQKQLDELNSNPVAIREAWNSLDTASQKAIGSFEIFAQKINIVRENSQMAIDQAQEKLGKFSSMFENMNLTGDELNALTGNLEEVFKVSGKEGVDIVLDQIKAITDTMDEEQAKAFAKTLSGIDWKNAGELQSVKDFIYELGVSEEAVDELISSIDELADAAYKVNLEKLAEQINDLMGFAAKVKSGEQGRTNIDESVGNALIQNSLVSASDLFYDALTGTYTYIGPDLQKIIEGIYEINDNLDSTAAEVQEAVIKNSPTENARLASESKVYYDALRVQAANSGMSEELLQNNLGDSQNLAQLTEVFQEAKEFELDIDNLNDYTKQMKTLGKTIDGVSVELDDVTAAQLALANTKQNAGMKKLVDSYEEWTKLIDEDGELMTDLDSDSEVVLRDLKSATNELLNTAEPLSEAFWKDTENLDLLTQAAEGSTGALIELRNKAAEDYLVSIGVAVDSENLPSEMSNIESWLAQNAPTLEVGTVIDTGPFIQGINDLIKKTGLGTEQIQAMFDALGFDLDVEMVEVEIPKMRWQETYNGFGTMVPDGTEKVQFPRVKSAAYKGGVGSGTTFASPSSGSGGGSSGSEKTDTWENPYDELYNLTEKINEALRTREALERRYEKLVKKTSSTVGEVTKGYYDQIRHLRSEADLQKEMLKGRARQIDNVANEMYMDSEGNRSSFADLGVTKYASYNKETGVITIDWESLEALEGDPSKVAEGEAAEAYISRLEELQGQYEEVRDKLWDIEDEIERLREEAIESYLSFEDRVMDDLVTHYQNQIDELSNLYDAIDQSTNEIIKGIQEEINYSRQIRDNTKKEEDIADKEARLAYLRRDTSGANAMEIKKLEEDIANSREQYSDTMVDQQIADMQNEAQLAAEQRQHQIEIMQNQLDVAQKNGELWGKVWELINTATDEDGKFSQNSDLVKLMQETEAYQSLSVVGQQKWWEDAAEAFLRAQSGLSEAEGKYGVDANGDGSVSSASSSANSSTSSSSGSASTSGSGSDISTEGAGHFAKVGTYEHPMAQMPSNEVKELQQALNDAGFTDDEGNTLKDDGIYGPRTRQAVWKLQEKLGNVKVDGYYGPETRSATLKSQFKAYATGGLADFTGPAWLDGTKSSPELVLNAKDTENFIALKNILANLLGGQGGDLIGNKGGDNYFDIHIAAEIGSDYDVDRLAEKIEKKIYEKSSYRNVNAINYLR